MSTDLFESEIYQAVSDLEMPEDFLAHYGVKGMKWGKRKEYVPVGRNTSSTRLTDTGTRSKALPVRTSINGVTNKVGLNPRQLSTKQSQLNRYKKLTAAVKARTGKTVSASKVQSVVESKVAEAVAKSSGKKSGGGSGKKASTKAAKAEATAKKSGGSGGSGSSKKASEKKSSTKKETTEKTATYKMTSQVKKDLKALSSQMLTDIRSRNPDFDESDYWKEGGMSEWLSDLMSSYWDKFPDDMKNADKSDLHEEAQKAMETVYEEVKKAREKEVVAEQKAKAKEEAAAAKAKEKAEKEKAKAAEKEAKEAAKVKAQAEAKKAQEDAIKKMEQSQKAIEAELEKRKKALERAKAMYHAEIICDHKGNVILGVGDLQHHGIQGMHWGERHGPPYPLSGKQHDAVVKAGKRMEKIQSISKRIDKGRGKAQKAEYKAAKQASKRFFRNEDKVKATRAKADRLDAKQEKLFLEGKKELAKLEAELKRENISIADVFQTRLYALDDLKDKNGKYNFDKIEKEALKLDNLMKDYDRFVESVKNYEMSSQYLVVGYGNSTGNAIKLTKKKK